MANIFYLYRKYFYMDVRKIFKNKMEERKVTNYWLAKHSGVSNSRLSKYFNNKQDLPFEAVIKISETLNIKLFPDETK